MNATLSKNKSNEIIRAELAELPSRFACLRRSPEYLLREYTVPCVVREKPVYLNPSIVGTELEGRVRWCARQVVPPKTVARLNKKIAADLAEMMAPYECGRVLEDPNTVMIDGVPHVLTAKGVGATRFVRDVLPSPENWTTKELKKNPEDLSTFAFKRGTGALFQSDAISELKNTETFKGYGLDTQKILAVYRIDELIDENGHYVSVEELAERGLLLKKPCITIMVRALKSNYRLEDLILLENMGQKESAKALLKLAHEMYRAQVNPTGTLQNYYEWLCSKVINQELAPIIAGYKMSSGFPHELARNISIMGEEIDLTEVSKEIEQPTKREHLYRFSHYWPGHVGRQLNVAVGALYLFGSALNSLSNERISIAPLAEAVMEGARRALKDPLISRYLKDVDSSYPKVSSEVRHNLVDGMFNLLAGGYRFGPLGSEYRDTAQAWCKSHGIRIY